MAIIKRAIQSTEVNGKGLGSDSVARLKKGFKPNTAGDIISQCKSRNITYREYATQETGKEHIGDEHRERVRMYAEVFRCVLILFAVRGELIKAAGSTTRNCARATRWTLTICCFSGAFAAFQWGTWLTLRTDSLNLVERHPHVVGKVKTVLIDEVRPVLHVSLAGALAGADHLHSFKTQASSSTTSSSAWRRPPQASPSSAILISPVRRLSPLAVPSPANEFPSLRLAERRGREP